MIILYYQCFYIQAVINSTITPNMTFTQTSQKFGQWSDVRANTVYGLGFASEAELGKFIEKFQEVKEATKNAMAKANTNGSSAVTPVTSANASPVTSRSSITQNDSFVSDIAEPPLSATGSVSFLDFPRTSGSLINFLLFFRKPKAHHTLVQPQIITYRTNIN